MQRDFYSEHCCEVSVAPWWSNGLLLGLHDSGPFGVYRYEDVLLSVSRAGLCLQPSSDEQTPKRQKRDESCFEFLHCAVISNLKVKEDCNVVSINQRAGFCF